MPVFTVHAPVDSGADLAATDKFTFVRDGFHFWAMVASVLWLLWHRLWLALIGWIALNAGDLVRPDRARRRQRHDPVRGLPDRGPDGL